MKQTYALGFRRLMVAVALSLIILATHGRPVYSQNNAVRNAAGAIILQNNRTQQELRETKRELREIKEGLGIESSTPGASSANPGVWVLAGAFLLVMSVWMVWAVSQARLLDQHLRAGDFKKYARSYEFRVVFIAFALAFLPWFALTRSQKEFLEGSGLAATAIVAWPILCFVVGAVLSRESRVRNLFDKASERLSKTANTQNTQTEKHSVLSWKRRGQQPVVSEASHFDQWFLRFPSGKIKGPRDGEDIRVFAKQGKYPPGTTWSQQVNGPWVPVPGVKAAASPPPAPVAPSVQWWIRTPDGKQSGPHTKEQLAKAASAGRLPQGTVAANFPNGPWKRIQLRTQT
jgi:hypothetical protein